MSIDNHSSWFKRINSITDASGGLNENSLSELAECTKEAISNDQRHKLALLLVSTHSKDILSMIVSNHDIIHQLEIWWDESVDNTNLMCLLLKVLDHLPFTVETLLQHKLAKKLSKLTKTVNEKHIQDLSRSLEIKWRRLVEEYNVSSVKSEHSQTDKLSQSPVNDTFDQPKSSEHVLPCKRKISESISKLSRKRVSFASSDSLVQVRYFECDPNERSGNVRSLEKGEFVPGYRSSTSMPSPSISWYFPKPFTCSFDISRGEESTEKKIQENREKYILATVYLDPSLVPQYPAEYISDNTLEKSEKIYIIPLEKNSQISYHESKQSSPSNDKGIDNELISLLNDPDFQKALDAVMGHSSNSHIK